MTDPSLFTYKMRKTTRKIHAISDALVNTKLALALNADAVWAESLLVFYEIFRFLEEVVLEKKSENLGKMFIKGLFRTNAFEQDLSHYYGENWKKNYVVRDSVANYLSHLKSLLNKDPDLLIAYVYHLYMGLLSGGQILRKKRELKSKVFHKEGKLIGEAVTDFGDIPISDLKNELRNVTNSIAETLDEDKRIKIIEEGNKVFELNNMIIKSVKSTNEVLLWRLLIIVSFLLLLIMSLFMYSYFTK